ncbi:MAG: hypothetical protein ACF8R7_04405 [Phycisphaerales bacterium JB039]
MPEAHTIIAMIATVLLLWGASLVARALRFRLPPLRTRRRKRGQHGWHRRPACAGDEPAGQGAKPPSLPTAAFGALISASSIPVFWASAQVYLAYGTRDPSVEPFTPWTGVALGCIAFGVAVMAWAIRGDRPRGRRRCRRCWYDMTGAPGLTCPECGREAPDATDLLRPRRKWRLAVVGLVIALLAVVPYHVPRVQRGGWVAAIPTTALILGLPWWPDAAIEGGSGGEDWSLVERVRRDRLRPWQTEWLRSRGRAIAAHGGSARRAATIGMHMGDHAITRSAAGTLVRIGLSSDRNDTIRFAALNDAASALSWLRIDGGDMRHVLDPYIDSLISIGASDDEYLCDAALPLLYFADDTEEVIPLVISIFEQPVMEADAGYKNTVQFKAAAWILGRHSDKHPEAIEALRDGLRRTDSKVHIQSALYALRICKGTADGLSDLLMAHLADPETAYEAAAAISRRPAYIPAALDTLLKLEASEAPDDHLVDPRVGRVLWTLLSSSDPATWPMDRLLGDTDWYIRTVTAVAATTSDYELDREMKSRLLAVLRDAQRSAPEDMSEFTLDSVAAAIRQLVYELGEPPQADGDR